MNQDQTIRVFSAGSMTPRVAQSSPVHSSGASRPPHRRWRRGSRGRMAAYSVPTSTEVRPWATRPTTSATPSKARSVATSASAIRGIAMPVVTEREAFDAPRRRAHPRRNALCRRYRHVLHALGGQHVAPPSDSTDEGEDDAHHAHGDVGHQPGEPKRHAECDHHRPHGGSGKLEAVEAFRVRHGLSKTLTARATAAPRMRLPTRRWATGRSTTVVCPPGIHSDEKRARRLPAPRVSWTPS